MDTRSRNQRFECKIAIIIFFKLILLVKSENQYNELPQLFSPRQPERFTGKIVYYEPKNASTLEESSTQVPWEDVLKETVVLTLNDRDDHSSIRKSTYSIKRRQKEIYRAPYIGMISPDAPKFGDIVLLARGRLERADNETYAFVQSDESCDRRCYERMQDNPNVTAMWTVERIRHRDHERGHRFELKFTVVPLNENKTHGADSGLRISKSYIVRDDDYPKYFVGDGSVTATVSKRSDRRTIFDMFDIMPIMNAFIPYSPRYPSANIAASNVRPELNIGEYTPRPAGQTRIPSQAMTVIRLPPKVIRYPDSLKSPFSGNPMAGIHLYMNGLQTQHMKLPGTFKTPNIGRPVFDLDKANDYSKLMEYKGSIDAKKVFPTPKEEEIKNNNPIFDNTLDWKAAEPSPKPQIEQKPVSYSSPSYAFTTVFESSSTHSPPVVSSSHAPVAASITQHHSPVLPQVSSHQMTSMIFPHPVHHHVHPPIQQVMVPHIPAMIVPLQNHFGVPVVIPNSNAIHSSPHHTHHSHHHHQNQLHHHQHHPEHQFSTTTHYGENNGAVQAPPVPPFIPLHHSMAKLRPLSRIPTTPPKKEATAATSHGFRESPKHENTKFSIPDPLYSSAVPPPTSAGRNVLPSPYSSPTSKAETSTIITFDNKPVHEKLEDLQEEFVPIGPTPWRDREFESSKTSQPDSINAQLPAPEKGTNIQIPYINEKVTSEKASKRAKAKITSVSLNAPSSTFETTPKQQRTRTTSLSYTTTTAPTSAEDSTSKYRAMYKTTDKPVLKWIPKKSRTKPTDSLDFVPTLSSTSTTIRTFVTRPTAPRTFPTTQTTTSSTSTTTTTTTSRPIIRLTRPSSTKQSQIEKVEATTLKPRPYPSAHTSTGSITTTTTASTLTGSSSSSTSRPTNIATRYNRGRHRQYLRRRDNDTADGTGAESKTSLTQTVSVEQRRRKIKRTRIQPTKVTTTTPNPYPYPTTTTSSASPFLPTTTVDPPPSTTADIVRAAIHPIDTNSTALLLYQASEPNSNELDTSLAEAILEHARALHSPENGFYFNHHNKKQHQQKSALNGYDKN